MTRQNPQSSAKMSNLILTLKPQENIASHVISDSSVWPLPVLLEKQ